MNDFTKQMRKTYIDDGIRERILDSLNKAAELDPQFHETMRQEIPVHQDIIAHHPSLQGWQQNGIPGHVTSPLAIINSLFEPYYDGSFPIHIAYDKDTGKFLGFKAI